MARKKSLIPGFSLKRATGVPTTKEGRKNKLRKKLLPFLVISLLLIGCVALGEAAIDWSQYSDEELTDTINELSAMLDGARAELESRGQSAEPAQAVKEVRVPVGVWYVGEDIPPAHYTITVAPDAKMSWGSVKIGTVLDDTGKHIDFLKSERRYSEMVRKKGSEAAVSLDELDYDFKEGDILIIEEADMIFTPFVKKKLGF